MRLWTRCVAISKTTRTSRDQHRSAYEPDPRSVAGASRGWWHRMSDSTTVAAMDSGWTNTTHDWSAVVDRGHLDAVRASAMAFAPSGTLHLLHEVLAYVADEAEACGMAAAPCEVIWCADGSFSVRDFGRGTDTRRDVSGASIRKPVMATKDLRFFDNPSTQTLPNGAARRGMSIVAALSEWLVHENRRLDGAWHQRYERGIPVTDLIEMPSDTATGTVVPFPPRT